jgi:membrane protein implicated in regulation of membrane protease activity
MFWMALIMALPLLGVALFFAYPWRVALFPYILLVLVSAVFDVFMMRAMKLPVSTGREEMIGTTAVVLNWGDLSGQVAWKSEIWRALYQGRLAEGDTVVIEDVRGVNLIVKPVGCGGAADADSDRRV